MKDAAKTYNPNSTSTSTSNSNADANCETCTSKSTIKLLEKNPEKISWFWLSSNSNALNWKLI